MDSSSQGGFMEEEDIALCTERYLRLKYTEETAESMLFSKQEKDITIYKHSVCYEGCHASVYICEGTSGWGRDLEIKVLITQLPC